MIIGKSFAKFLFFYVDRKPRWPPLQDMLLTQDPDRMGKYRNILLSETTELIEPKPYMDVLWMNLLFSAFPYSSQVNQHIY